MDVLEIAPLAAYNPMTENLEILVGDQEFPSHDSNKSTVESNDKTMEYIPPNHFLVHTKGGGHMFLEQGKWPVLKLPQQTGSGGTLQEGGISKPLTHRSHWEGEKW